MLMIGSSVSLSGNGARVAVGTNEHWQLAVGHVQVYEWDGLAWNPLGAILEGEAVNDYSASSVSLSYDGSRVAIGAPGNDIAHGHARVYEWNSTTTTWNLVGADIDGAENDLLGQSVSLSSDGMRVAIGAPGNDIARVYDWNGTAWTQVGTDIEGEQYDNTGWSVSLSSDGERVAVGAYRSNGVGGSQQWVGQTRLFEFHSGCPAPTDLSASNVTPTGATLSWVSDGTQFTIELLPAGFPQGTGTEVSTVSTTIKIDEYVSLSPGTSYDFYVVNVCDTDSSSDYAGPFTFTTLPSIASPQVQVEAEADTGAEEADPVTVVAGSNFLDDDTRRDDK